MNEILTQEENAGAQAPVTEFYLGTVITWGISGDSAGVQIQLDGDEAAMVKRYKMLKVSRDLPVGSRVVVMKQAGTYIVLGEIGTPYGIIRQGPLSSSATTAQIIAALNNVITALRGQGVIWPPTT